MNSSDTTNHGEEYFHSDGVKEIMWEEKIKYIAHLLEYMDIESCEFL
jgi:hypothetical protein